MTQIREGENEGTAEQIIETVLSYMQPAFLGHGPVPFSKVREILEAKDAAYAERIKGLEAQLPKGMKHCTIQFKTCEVGHGRLTATNWTDNGCQFCRITALEDENGRLKSEVDRLISANEHWHLRVSSLKTDNDAWLDKGELLEARLLTLEKLVAVKDEALKQTIAVLLEYGIGVGGNSGMQSPGDYCVYCDWPLNKPWPDEDDGYLSHRPTCPITKAKVALAAEQSLEKEKPE